MYLVVVGKEKFRSKCCYRRRRVLRRVVAFAAHALLSLTPTLTHSLSHPPLSPSISLSLLSTSVYWSVTAAMVVVVVDDDAQTTSATTSGVCFILILFYGKNNEKKSTIKTLMGWVTHRNTPWKTSCRQRYSENYHFNKPQRHERTNSRPIKENKNDNL